MTHRLARIPPCRIVASDPRGFHVEAYKRPVRHTANADILMPRQVAHVGFGAFLAQLRLTLPHISILAQSRIALLVNFGLVHVGVSCTLGDACVKAHSLLHNAHTGTSASMQTH